MKTEPFLSTAQTTIPISEIPDGILNLEDCSKWEGQVANLIFIDLPDEAPDVNPTERVTIHVFTHKDGPLSGTASVMVTAVRHVDSTQGGLPAQTLAPTPTFYLTISGVKAIRHNLAQTEYAKWRLARPTNENAHSEGTTAQSGDDSQQASNDMPVRD
jgi:hypothetical protein